jgi:MFS transporter, MHS family, metabolite:H+ symporter
VATNNRKNPSSRVSEAEPVKVTPHDLGLAAWTCSLGSALEYYDFALYSLASALIFGPLFFPQQSHGLAQIESFGTYFIGFAIRPLVASSLARLVIGWAESSC